MTYTVSSGTLNSTIPYHTIVKMLKAGFAMWSSIVLWVVCVLVVVGFTELCQDDQIKLIKQGSFEVILARYMPLFTEDGMFVPDMSVKVTRSESFILSSLSYFTLLFSLVQTSVAFSAHQCSSVLWHCWLGDRKGVWPVKKLGVDLLVETFWLEICTCYSFVFHMISHKHLNLLSPHLVHMMIQNVKGHRQLTWKCACLSVPVASPHYWHSLDDATLYLLTEHCCG